MRKKALLLAAAILAVLALTGCLGQQRKAPTVYYSILGMNGEANCYIAANGGLAAVIDPSTAPPVIGKLKELQLQPEYIILTHGHFDHIGGIDAIKQEFPAVKVLIHPGDMDKLADPTKNLSAQFGGRIAAAAKALPVTDGQAIGLGDDVITVISTPGHTPGSVCLSVGNLLFSGDTLFKDTVGRTDLPGGSAEELQSSLHKLDRFPEATLLLPGHGDAATLGEERKNNPFLLQQKK